MTSPRQDTVLDEYKRPVPGASVYVYDVNNANAVLTSDGVTPVTQPLTTDEFGVYSYYADHGFYREDVWFGGRLRYKQAGVAVGDAVATLDAAVEAAQAAASLALAGVTYPPAPGTGAGLMPESFGALGNGIANDTAAFQAMAAVVNAAGGGCINLRPGAVYIVGSQTLVNSGGWMFKGTTILTIDGCSLPFVLRGNGAKIKVASGLKFGTFAADGTPTTHTLPYFGGDQSSFALEGIITIKNCTARVHVENLEIDGNDIGVTWGGPFGDDGWQIPPDNVFLYNNSLGETFLNVVSHRGVRDGFQVVGIHATVLASPKSNSIFIGCTSEYNTRQGLSFTGGRGYTFMSCRFSHTGKGSHRSSPAAGVDMEQEDGIIRDLAFIDCDIMDNDGAGFLAVGDVANIHCLRCKLIGTTNWSFYYPPPFMVFEECLFAGVGIAAGGQTPSPAAEPKFYRCTFTDDPTVSPTGVIYASGSLTSVDTDLGGTYFEACNIVSVNSFGPVGGHFHACSFTFTGGQNFRGPKLTGRTRITADNSSNITNSTFTQPLGSDISRNGTPMRQGSATWNPASVGILGRVTTTVNVPWARLSDRVIVTFSNSLQGLTLGGYVSTPVSTDLAADGVVTVTLDNFTGGAIDLASGTLTVVVVGRDTV